MIPIPVIPVNDLRRGQLLKRRAGLRWDGSEYSWLDGLYVMVLSEYGDLTNDRVRVLSSKGIEVWSVWNLMGAREIT